MNKNYLVMLFLFLAAVAQVFAGGPEQRVTLGADDVASGYNLLTDAEKTQAISGDSSTAFACSTFESNSIHKVINTDTQAYTRRLSIANNGTESISTRFGVTAEIGELLLVCTSDTTIGSALILCREQAAAPLEIYDVLSKYGVAGLDTAGLVNVYTNGTDVLIRNKTGGTLTFLAQWRGSYP